MTARPKEPKDNKPMYHNPIASGDNRNRICPCGSGTKIKRCHGQNKLVTLQEAQHILEMVNEFNRKFRESLQKNIQDEVIKRDK